MRIRRTHIMLQQNRDARGRHGPRHDRLLVRGPATGEQDEQGRQEEILAAWQMNRAAPEKQPAAPEKQPAAPEKQPAAPEKQPASTGLPTFLMQRFTAAQVVVDALRRANLLAGPDTVPRITENDMNLMAGFQAEYGAMLEHLRSV